MTDVLIEQPTTALDLDVPEIDYDALIIESSEAIEIFVEKQQRLLVEPLYSSWKTKMPFFAAANVGVFSGIYEPPVIPDMFLSLETQVLEDLWNKEHHFYFPWIFGKTPDVAIEIVTNTHGEETGQKLARYDRMYVWYYVIFDPQQFLRQDVLQVYARYPQGYILQNDERLEEIGLGLTLWDGLFEGVAERWLRWCDLEGQLIPTGAERAETLIAQLRAMGIEPEA